MAKKVTDFKCYGKKVTDFKCYGKKVTDFKCYGKKVTDFGSVGKKVTDFKCYGKKVTDFGSVGIANASLRDARRLSEAQSKSNGFQMLWQKSNKNSLLFIHNNPS